MIEELYDHGMSISEISRRMHIAKRLPKICKE